MKPTKGDYEKAKQAYFREQIPGENDVIENIAQALTETRTEAAKEIRKLLITGLELMQKINGSYENCLFINPTKCVNHAWIDIVKHFLAVEEGK